MNPIYEKLFDSYGLAILRDGDNFDDDAINAYLDTLPLDKRTKNRLNDALRPLPPMVHGRLCRGPPLRSFLAPR